MKAEAMVPAVDRMTMGVMSRISVLRDGLGSSSSAVSSVGGDRGPSAGATSGSRRLGLGVSAGWASSTP